ncbi:MAG: SurA N-terminal domain-containing protein [Gemmobacter sp.]|jgi:peptidyl-prolyl cis-trans isomerase D|nr:SurA N-terminal domain-containing protein [Gemmobacter sp.]
MSPKRETDSPKRKPKGSSILVWVLLAMVITGLGGFGVQNFGGRVQSIGSVGGREIGVNDYARALQAEVGALSAQLGTGQIGMQEALSLGVDAKVRRQLVTAAALDDANDRLGLSVGDASVAQEIAGMPAFRGPSGTFDAATYRSALDRNNLTDIEFEAQLRDQLARSLLQGAVAGGFVAPAEITERLYAFISERRGFTLLRLTEADLPQPLPAPTDDELKAHYEANIAAFTRAEAKQITYAALLPEKLAATMAPDEAKLRELYDAHHDEFLKPERRLVERLVFGSEAEAEAARARIDAGESFDAIVAERGLAPLDIDLGDVSRAELGAAGDAVFALTEPGVAGPLPSDLGPALYRMNAVLAAQETSFEEAKPGLAVEYQQDAARRAIADRIEAIDDALAGGATLEDLATEQGMELGRIDYTATSDDDIAGYPAFRAAAARVQEGDFPEAVQLEDGGVVVLRLDEVVPAAPIPFEEARGAVAESWRREALHKALSARAAAIKAEVESGAGLGTFGILSVTSEIARDGFVEGTPKTLLPAVFRMTEGEMKVIESGDFVGLLRLDHVMAEGNAETDAAALQQAIGTQAEQALSQDALTLFSAAMAAAAGITLDQAAIDAVHAQLR